MSDDDNLDPEHDPIAYTKVVIRGFEDFDQKTTKKAQEVFEKYAGQSIHVAQVGLAQLNELGETTGDYVQQAGEGIWPVEILPILGRTMKVLTEVATRLKDSAKPFDVIDMSDFASNGPAGSHAN